MSVRPITPSALRKQLAEAVEIMGPSLRVLFRDAAGREYDLSKVKMRSGTIVLCEREDD